MPVLARNERVNDDLYAKENNISPEFDFHDDLIMVAIENLSTNADCSACSSVQIDRHEDRNTTFPIISMCMSKQI